VVLDDFIVDFFIIQYIYHKVYDAAIWFQNLYCNRLSVL